PNTTTGASRIALSARNHPIRVDACGVATCPVGNPSTMVRPVHGVNVGATNRTRLLRAIVAAAPGVVEPYDPMNDAVRSSSADSKVPSGNCTSHEARRIGTAQLLPVTFQYNSSCVGNPSNPRSTV